MSTSYITVPENDLLILLEKSVVANSTPAIMN